MQQCATAALYQVEIAIDLVGTVDGQIQPARRVEGDDLDADLARQIGGAGRGGHAADAQPFVAHQIAEGAHHVRGGAAGAKPDTHPVLDEIDRAFRGHLLGRVDG